MSFREWLFGPEVECKVCHELRSQLDYAQRQNKYLLEKHFPEPQPMPERSEVPKPINKLPVPWNIQRSILEKEDRAQAVILKRRAKEIKDAKSVDELEKSLDIKSDENEKKEEVNG